MSVSTPCLRLLTLSYDVLFVVLAFVLTILNCYFLYQFLFYKQFISVEECGPTITLIVIGFFSFLLSWIGWKGAWNSNRFLIAIFGILLLGVVITEIGCWVWSVAIWDNLNDHLEITVAKEFSLATFNNTEASLKGWEKIQSQLSCCGVGGPSDYRNSKALPWSCCAGSIKNMEPGLADCATLHQRGCLSQIYSETRNIILYAGLSGLATGLLQMMGVFCSLYFAITLQRESGKNYQTPAVINGPFDSEYPESSRELLDTPRLSQQPKY